MIEIKIKKKHIAGKGLYGYPRTGNGNSHKKVKKLGNALKGEPYDKRSVVLVLENGRHKRWYKGDEARQILERDI